MPLRLALTPLVANIIGGMSWACFHGFGAYAVGTKIKRIAGGCRPQHDRAGAVIAGIVLMRGNRRG
jgi:hypothetical protein